LRTGKEWTKRKPDVTCPVDVLRTRTLEGKLPTVGDARKGLDIMILDWKKKKKQRSLYVRFEDNAKEGQKELVSCI
jgi:hypothetical protein